MTVGSPFSTGVLEAERVFRGSVGGGGGGHGHSQSCADLMSEEETSSSLSSKTDTEEKAEDTRVVSRRDIATQMTPNNNHHSPPQELSPPLVVSVIEPPPPCRGGEVREVKVDKGARLIKRPKRRVMSSSSSSSRIIRRDHQPEVQDNSSSWDISEPAMTLFKLHREEAKIAAWENLQKAKAEAAMRKLEVKLEKKKSASMDKILNKLQTAKMKAQEMRRSTTVSSSGGDHQKKKEEEIISRNSAKITHLVRRHTFMTPFMTCFAPRVDCRKSSSAL
ncbi:Remorin family protein [Raphanus sativus]|nr:Remorin family protein [Raphanus sativus]